MKKQVVSELSEIFNRLARRVVMLKARNLNAFIIGYPRGGRRDDKMKVYPGMVMKTNEIMI